MLIKKKKKINYIKNSHIIQVENKGVDTYPFLVAIQYIRNHNIPTDYILELHTKESINKVEDLNDWRKDLIKPITNYNNLLVLQHYFVNNTNIGYVTSQKCVLPKSYDLDFPHNIRGINNLCEKILHLEKDWTDFNGGNKLTTHYNYNMKLDNLHINHYMLMSEQYYKTVKSIRGVGQSNHSKKYTMKFLMILIKNFQLRKTMS